MSQNQPNCAASQNSLNSRAKIAKSFFFLLIIKQGNAGLVALQGKCDPCDLLILDQRSSKKQLFLIKP